MSIEIDHLGIAVTSLEGAMAFYEAQLGLSVTHRETVEGERVRVAMLPASDTPDGPRLELLEATGPDSTVARFIEKRGPGLHHLALRVDDLVQTVERLRAQGSQVLHEPQRGADGHLYVFVHPSSTGGMLLELIQKEENKIAE